MESITEKRIFNRLKTAGLFFGIFLLCTLIIFSGCSKNTAQSANTDNTGTAVQTESSQDSATGQDSSRDNAGSGTETLQDDNNSQTGSNNEITVESGDNNASTTVIEKETAIDKNSVLFTFAVAGDNRPSNDIKPQPEVFVKLLKYMKQQNPYFYISTGDLIMGNTVNTGVIKRQFSEYLDAVKNLGAINFVAPGNHDVANGTSWKYFAEMINTSVFNNAGPLGIKINSDLQGLENTGSSEVLKDNNNPNSSLYYYFEYKGVYFVMLNAYEKGHWGLIEADQLFWLEQILSKLKDEKVFIFLHPPVYSVLNPDCITDGSVHVSFSSKENQDYIRALFAQFKVDAVFSGHEHLYNKQVHDGVQYIISGCSGASPYAPADEGGIYHFIKVRIKPESWIMEAIDSSGNNVYIEEILFN